MHVEFAICTEHVTNHAIFNKRLFSFIFAIFLEKSHKKKKIKDQRHLEQIVSLCATTCVIVLYIKQELLPLEQVIFRNIVDIYINMDLRKVKGDKSCNTRHLLLFW